MPVSAGKNSNVIYKIMATKELTQGNPLKLIFFFALPIFLGNLFQQFYNIIDALIVGRILGVEALASVGATTPLIFLFISFIFASTQGFSVVTAQKFGAREYDLVKKSVFSSFVLSFFLTLILTLLSAPFSYFMLSFLRTPQNIIQDANSYLFIMFAGIFATVFYNLSSNIIRALGDSKTPLYFLIFASFLNILLDILFILKFHTGVMGAGLATVISQGVSTILCITYMFIKFPILRLRKQDCVFDKPFLLEHLRIGIPMGFQMSVLSIGIIALQFVLNGFGHKAIAAFTTSMRVDQALSQSFLALGAAIATYTAQNFGANKISRIRRGAKISVSIVLIISVVSFVIIYCFGKSIISAFMSVPDEEVLKLSMQYLYTIVLFFPFLGTLLAFRNILQGMGKVKAPLLSGVAELVARASGAFILGYYFGYSGICFATPLAWCFGALVLLIGYKLSIRKNLKRKKSS